MGQNIGYLTSDRTIEGDERYTPYYAVQPLLKYIPKGTTVWCPFDEDWSAFYQTFKSQGISVIRSSLREGQDFFKYEPDNYDLIISNPPFSKKDDVLARIYELGKPFALLLPLQTLQGKRRFNYMAQGLQILAFDARIGFHTQNSMLRHIKGNHFASVYFCKDFLPQDLILEELTEYEQPLIQEAALYPLGYNPYQE